MMNDIGVLSIQFQTLFLTSVSGRIERENDPDHSPGPRLWLGGCASGNIAGLRSDVRDDLTTEIMDIIAKEPPFFTRDGRPQYLDLYIELLSRESAVSKRGLGVIYEFPNNMEYRHGVTLIDSESEEGKRLYASLSMNGMPAGLFDMGFRDVSHFWDPWCVAMHDGQVVSVAFTARLSKAGAEIGVATAPALRGRGYAAAAAAGWSRLQSLQSRALFYSTDQTNTSSQRVAARLGLRFLGASLRLS